MTSSEKRYEIRRLQETDYHLGFLQVLNQLTKTNTSVSFEKFANYFHDIDDSRNQTWVILDTESKRIVGTGKIVIEPKFHQNFANMGHIEDVVIDSEYRNHKLGQLIIQNLLNVAKAEDCYKVTLACSERNVGFYAKCGLMQKGIEMTRYFR
jgi:glucosamine-phosphate N-acetyltransferase